MDHTARFNSLIERVADAPAPSRELFAEVWFATTGKQHPDIKGRFAVLMDAKAWTEAALIAVACALPDWRVVTKASHGAGEGTPSVKAAVVVLTGCQAAICRG
ncbi:hypothetical protein FV226_15605 [Methylobacterium sp. WL12]|uniref:hypothetical protein n=1 Tax=Methylobacterium sp. WL12 TaxID=2603890 RepID=UPI0011C872D9|nr:hypothetical protein [Methylobacterium sp. WL12]TXM71370.1 hypothetical protein FV226_15605 [Methylobacterium sp. WL12]